MRESRKHTGKLHRIHCGYIAMGGLLAMLFCRISSSPVLMFAIGLLLVVIAFAVALGRRLQKERLFPWW